MLIVYQDEFKIAADEIPNELSLQMGRWALSYLAYPMFFLMEFIRPVSQGPGEIRGFLERANYMIDIAGKSLADITLEDTDKPGFRRFIKRVPLGVALIIVPWKSVFYLPFLKNQLTSSLLAIRTLPP